MAKKTPSKKALAKVVARPAIAEAVAEAVKKNPRPTAPKAEKAKRVILNPQPIIDAKTAALKELGVKLTYAGRNWHAGDREFTSLELSKYSVDEFAALFAKGGAKSKPAAAASAQKSEAASQSA